ncbi:hypothetical protein MMC07_008701 [Pseudocyphellaria aurata]|nr:hypothetical protein [Pseudocyphellaria aurata]
MANPEDLKKRVAVPADITPRDHWARWQTRRRLAKVYTYASNHTLDSLPKSTFSLLPELGSKINPDNLPTLPAFNPRKPEESLPHEMKVCIVGAGAAGLFTAMIFDWLKEKSNEGKIPELNISYDIYEAAEKDREHQYYDVGAMRFPENPIMRRTFDLFEKLGIHKKGAKHPDGKLIPYYIKAKDKNNTPSYYNDIYYAVPPPKDKLDPYEMRIQTGPPIPEDLLKKGPKKTLQDAIAKYRQAFREDPEKGWRMLIDTDKFTARDFLQLPPLSGFKTINSNTIIDHSEGHDVKKQDDKPIGGPGFNFNTVEWLETFGGGTHWYSQAFSEMVLENMDFDYYEEEDEEEKEPATNWWCIDGGANVLAQQMEKSLTRKPTYCSAVTSIRLEETKDTHNLVVEIVNPDKESHNKYAAVFNSTTLGAMQRMDLTGAKLNLGTKQAIRTLNYGASCKVGIRFSKAWWIQSPYNIRGGLAQTDLPIRTCVYPSYNLEDCHDKPAVLLCSYTWEQDASRIGSLISDVSPNHEESLKKLLFRNLALLHSTTATYKDVYKMIEDSYIAHHAYDWYKDQHSVGAFAFFGPSQFKEVWPDITCPSADGKLIIIGEAASTHHAWVVGALESAMRGVYQFVGRYASIYPQYNEALKYLDTLELKPEDIPGDQKYQDTPEDKHDYQRPFGPLPYSFETKVAQHQVVVSMLRAEGKLSETPLNK